MRELKKLNEEDLLFYDIETAPVVKELQLDTPLFDSWEYKVNKAGDKSNEEVIASYSKEAGLYPEFAKVISIVVGKITEDGIKLITFDDPDEAVLLKDFNSVLKRRAKDTIVGFVNVGFDTPFVFKRMLINGIKANDMLDSSGLKPWEVAEVDLAKMWQGTSFNRASLINIAVAFGLASPKDDISGADVGNVYWNEEGGLPRISKYCRKDVTTTINIFRKMCLREALEVVDGGDFEDVPLITNLFGGGAYGKEEKAEMKVLFDNMTEEQRDLGYVILNAIASTAKGKKTKLTKTHIKTLKASYDTK
jgi:DNA polymerase elongation subunit (family B)